MSESKSHGKGLDFGRLGSGGPVREDEKKSPFNYTDAEDLKVSKPTSIGDINERLTAVEDKISDLLEHMAVLVAIARKDHPDLVADWPDE